MSSTFARSAGLTVVLTLGLLGLDRLAGVASTAPGSHGLLTVLADMRDADLNHDDFHARAANYYEGIERGARIAPGSENDDYLLRDDFLRYEFKPNVRRPYPAGMRITNSLGMPNPEYGFEKPPHTRRIAWLGDSIAVGPYGQDFVALLEKQLNAAAVTADIQRFQILNFAVPGYILLQQLDVVLDKAPKFHPDAYVLQLSSQELLGSRNHISRLVVSGTGLRFDFLKQMVAQAGIRPTDRRSLIGLKLAPFFVPMTRWAVEQIRDRVTERGARLIIALMPVPMNPKVTAADFDQLHTAIDGLGVPILDLRDTFASANLAELQVSTTDIHPNARGHQMIFADLYGKLRAQPEAWAALVSAGSVF